MLGAGEFHLGILKQQQILGGNAFGNGWIIHQVSIAGGFTMIEWAGTSSGHAMALDVVLSMMQSAGAFEREENGVDRFKI